tara:strand:- start:4306 stop:5739 length:1434 start_codon:yes stop_codon:yes gene_type:complete
MRGITEDMSEIKNFVKILNKQPVLVYGLGKSGSATVNALSKAGAQVVIGDDNPDNYKKFKRKNITQLDITTQDFSEFAYLILSPGIPLTHPEPHDVVKKAQEADLEIFCDIELFTRIYPSLKTIGITSTNGKSTTSALVTHLLIGGGQKAVLGGNIGTPVFELDVESDPPDWVVLEISSFQIDLCPVFRPDIAVILNLTPDHIDRHGTMEHYADVKERITELGAHSTDATAVICTDDEHTRNIYARARDLELRDVIEISTLKTLSSGVYVEDGTLFDVMDGDAKTIGDLSKMLALKGIHNHQNAACAYAAVKMAGVAPAKIWAGFESFPGLNHRQFPVRTINGVGFVNDSKSTNAASAAVALGCQNNVYWIVGGKRKKTGLDGLENFFPHIKHAFLIGESTEEFANWFDKYGMDYTRCFTLENAVLKAHNMAQENRGQPGGTGVVLLSPACASFDQYDSFEHRGNHFAEIVRDLPEE